MAAHRKARSPWLVQRLNDLPLKTITNRSESLPSGCRIWTGSMARGRPLFHFAEPGGDKGSLDARTLVYELTNECRLALNWECRCAEHALCIHPDHLELRRRKCSPIEAARIRAMAIETNRARSKLSIDDVARIRSHVGPITGCDSEKYQISVRHMRNIRDGKRWVQEVVRV